MTTQKIIRQDIKSLDENEVETLVKLFGFERYRSSQIFSGLCRKVVRSWSEIRNIPKDLKQALEEKTYFNNIECVKRFVSVDRTEKFLFRLQDGELIESVLIVSGVRKTLCISTQVGCKFGCAFCASGQRGYVRQLDVSEITGQVMHVRSEAGHTLTNYVFMGMGEPLDNVERLIKAIGIMTSKTGMGIGARRITVSTCGIVPGIRKLADSGINVNLSLSLHATTDALRSELMPANRLYPLGKVLEMCGYFTDRTNNELTLEYIMLDGKNDSPDDAVRLARIAGKLGAKVNLIPYSSVCSKDFAASRSETINRFMSTLEKSGVIVMLRESKGKDIEAACGQLAYRTKAAEK